jgi:hypothetical protein
VHKYRAVKTTIDDIVFPSGLEADTYRRLRDVHDSGGMKNLRLQVPYPLHSANGKKVCTYQLDFLAELEDGSTIAFESKGVMTPVASLKLKLFSAEYGIPLVVITSKNLPALRAISSIVRSTVQSYRPMAFKSEVQEQFFPKKTKRRSRKAA